MNLIYFIRLLLKHWLLLLLGPIILFCAIFFLTKDEPKVYNSFTSIYTGLASGSSLTSLESSKIDRVTTMTAFDNLINIVKLRSTIEEVGLRLFTSHMILEEPNPEVISRESYYELMNSVPDKIKKLVVKNDFDATYKAFVNYKIQNNQNYIYKLIELDNTYYGFEKILKELTVRRKNLSDMIEISYSATDPGICQQTLVILINVFIKNYADVKINQSDAILRYFQDQLNLAQEKLDLAEDELLQFNKDNNIINYYEQTEYIASQKESFDAKFNEIRMEYASAAAVLKVLEEKLSVQQRRVITNSKVLELRDQLAAVNIEKALKEYQSQFDTINQQLYIDEIAELSTESTALQNQLREQVNKAYFMSNSIEGVESNSVLTQWLETVINLESSEAKLVIGEQRKDEFRSTITEYAPKGAQMKRLERKIAIAEREYLSILESLNLAKLKQQNVELNSNLKVSDPPLYPNKSLPSKRKILLLVGLVIGFIIPAALIILLDFIDQSLKTEKRAEEFTGLTVAAIYPKIGKKVSRSLDIDNIKARAIDVLARKLILSKETNKAQEQKPDTNIVFSILDEEGKSTILGLLAERLADIGYKVLVLSDEKYTRLSNVEVYEYVINDSFHKCEVITDLMDEADRHKCYQNDFVFVEIPGILQNSFPINLFNGTDHSFMVTRANRAWTKSDTNAIKDILSFTEDKKPQILLNGVEIEEMENVIGDLPRKRSFIRRFVKNVIRLQFFSKDRINGSKKKQKKKQKKR